MCGVFNVRCVQVAHFQVAHCMKRPRKTRGTELPLKETASSMDSAVRGTSAALPMPLLPLLLARPLLLMPPLPLLLPLPLAAFLPPLSCSRLLRSLTSTSSMSTICVARLRLTASSEPAVVK